MCQMFYRILLPPPHSPLPCLSVDLAFLCFCIRLTTCTIILITTFFRFITFIFFFRSSSIRFFAYSLSCKRDKSGERMQMIAILMILTLSAMLSQMNFISKKKNQRGKYQHVTFILLNTQGWTDIGQ